MKKKRKAMEDMKKICKDCFLLELRTYYLHTEKVTGYCSMMKKRRNGNDVCAMPRGNETLQGGYTPKEKKETNSKCEKYTLKCFR